MITETGKFQDIDWGHPLDDSDPDQVKAWCESMGEVYDPELTGPKMMSHVRKSRTVADKPDTKKVVTKKPADSKPTVSVLKAQCKALGIKGFSKMKKPELEAAIADLPDPTKQPDEPVAIDEPDEPVAIDESDDDLEVDQNGDYIGFVWPDVDE